MKKFVPVFEINRQPSRFLRWLVFSFFLLLLISCWFNALSFSVQLGLSASVLFITVYFIRLDSLNGGNVTKIFCKADGSWLITKRGLKPESYKLIDTSAILGPLFFLHFKSKTQNLHLVLANDSMTAEEARKLRVALRVYKSQLLEARV